MARSSSRRHQSRRGKAASRRGGLPQAAEPPRRDTHRALSAPKSSIETRRLQGPFRHSCAARRLMVRGERMQHGTRDILIAREGEEIGLQARRYTLWDSDLERLVPFRFAAANSRCLRRLNQHSGD